MRVLILSCNTGEGHNSCAAAIQAEFESRGDQCLTMDALNFISEGTSKFVSKWHVRLSPKCLTKVIPSQKNIRQLWTKNLPRSAC